MAEERALMETGGERGANIAYRVAVATSDGYLVNRHFGRAERFDIYAALDDLSFRREEERFLPAVCQGGDHSEEAMQARIASLKDCSCVLVSRIGLTAAMALEAENMKAYEIPGYVEESLDQLIRFRAVESLLMES